MKKTLIALALTTLPVAAMAEVTLYGQIKAGYETSSSKTSGEDRTSWTNGIADYGSRIGFKGNEDLGNGLKAIWQVESRVNLADGLSSKDGYSTSKNNLATRDSFIGLASDFGTIRAGYLSDYANDSMEDVDPWEYGSDVLGLGTFTRLDGRYAGLRYDSPDFAGFNFALGFSPRDNNADRTVPTAAKYWVGLGYQNSGFFGKYQFKLAKNNAGYDLDGQAHRFEGGYDANNLFVGVGYQYAKNFGTYDHIDYTEKDGDELVLQDYLGKKTETQEAALTLGYHFGNLFPKISYAHGWDVKVDGKKEEGSKYDQVVVGTDYSFSKRTTANAQVGYKKVGGSDDSTKTTAFGVGLKHVF